MLSNKDLYSLIYQVLFMFIILLHVIAIGGVTRGGRGGGLKRYHYFLVPLLVINAQFVLTLYSSIEN